MAELISSDGLRQTFSMAWLTIFSAAYGLACSTAAYGGLRRRLRGLFPTSIIALLLLISGLQINPGPSISIGSFNARSVVLRGPLILDMINTQPRRAGCLRNGDNQRAECWL